MRIVDASRMRLVHRGEDWPLQADPSSKAMIRHLVRNEKLVTWLQPAGRGPEAQVPVLRVGTRFCALSVRMMKAIWSRLIVPPGGRDVRLRQGFVNLEPLPQGGFKPRIPERLLQDKRRTQCRFRAMRQRDMERKSKERRGISIMTRKIHGILQDVILPLSGEVGALPRTTEFTFTEGDAMRALFERARRECPSALADKATFLRRMSDMYEELCAPPPATRH